MIHGRGGGHDQGMSRFGYLRTPRPTDVPPEAQADAHVCLLDALAIRGAAGLRDDMRLGKGLKPYALASIQAPTLVVSARDDGFGTYAPAKYTARQIAGAKFLGFDQGGHLLVGHDETVRAAILSLLRSSHHEGLARSAKTTNN